jgi:hypothetical protein
VHCRAATQQKNRMGLPDGYTAEEPGGTAERLVRMALGGRNAFTTLSRTSM